ncbi:MAG: HEAT repeat domain-containing protein [Verrucomicrobia bacterium]|nr:HEAT repeat domain-containing protein [Verrucomicrobiota bacterium]
MLLLAALAVAAILLAALFGPSLAPEPQYNGRPLSGWLHEFDTATNSPAIQRAQEALLAFGPAAAPPLAKRLDAGPPPFLLRLANSRLVAKLDPKMAFGRWVYTRAAKADDLRFWSSQTLRKLGPNARSAVPKLARALGRDRARGAALEILSGLGPQASPAVSAVARLLGASDGFVRERAAFCLGQIGTAASKAIPAVLSATTEHRVPLATGMEALAGMGYQLREALPFLIAQCQTNKPARYEVARWVRRIGPDGAPAVPVLIEVLGDDLPQARARICAALGAIGPESSAAVPMLTKALNDEWWYVRRNAATALGKIGSASRPAIAALTVAQQDLNEEVRDAGTEAIRLIRSELTQ